MRNPITLSDQELTGSKGNNPLKTLGGNADEYTMGKTQEKPFDANEREILFNYTAQLGFSKESEMIVLSSTHHYFYDAEEMKNTTAVTSLKELNKIRDLKSFFKSLSANLQPKSFFIGYFTDSRRSSKYSQNSVSSEEVENGIKSRNTFLNTIYGLLDAKTYNALSGRTVEFYLRNCGFKVVDMTLINGITCICAQLQPTVKI